MPVFLASCISKRHQVQALLKADKNWEEASAANDAKRLVSFYDTAGFAVNRTRLVKGLPALDHYWKDVMNSPGFHLTWEAQGADVSRKFGYIFGPWKLEYLKGGKKAEEKGMYVAVWRKQRNGDWKILIDKP